MNILSSLIVLWLTFAASFALAAVSEPVVIDQSEARLIAGGYGDDTKLHLGLDFKIKKNWKMYWRDPGDTGFPPQLSWEGSENIETVEFLWPAPKRHIDNFGGLKSESYTYQNEVVFPMIVTPKDLAMPVRAKVKVDYGICAEICIPATAEFELEVVPGYIGMSQMEKITNYTRLVPKPNSTYGMTINEINMGRRAGTDEFFLQITATNTEQFNPKKTDIFIEVAGKAAFYQPEMLFSKDKHSATFTAPIAFLVAEPSFGEQDITVTLVDGMNSVEKTIPASALGKAVVTKIEEAKSQPVSYTLGLIIVFALIGGLILNVMPCVLPVLSIKVLGVVQHGGHRKGDVAMKFAASAIGIIVSFLFLALIIIMLRAAGMNVGWGFHFQEPVFIIALVVILTLFAANLWGFFEINLPGNSAGTLANASVGNGLTSHFMSGVLATVLATPCTAPFLGTAVGFAVSRGPSDILITFIAMGIGMAAPYLLLTLFPGAVTHLPRPGAWMVKVKHCMALLLVFTAIWLIWVLSNQLGTVAALVLLALSAAKLLKLWAGRHVKFLAGRSVRMVGLALIIVLAFTLPMRVAEQQIVKSFAQETLWVPFKQSTIDVLVSSGKVVFVDITADWCLTCKVNKALVLNTADVVEVLKHEDVVAMRADWTNKDEAIAGYLLRHNRVGIPFNIVYGPSAPEGIILSELLNKKSVLSAIEKAGR